VWVHNSAQQCRFQAHPTARAAALIALIMGITPDPECSLSLRRLENPAKGKQSQTKVFQTLVGNTLGEMGYTD